MNSNSAETWLSSINHGIEIIIQWSWYEKICTTKATKCFLRECSSEALCLSFSYSVELVNVTAEGCVLLFNVNNWVFVKEQLMSIGLEETMRQKAISPSTETRWYHVIVVTTSQSPHPMTQSVQPSAVTCHSGCHVGGCGLFLLHPCRQSPLLLKGPAHPHIPRYGRSIFCQQKGNNTNQKVWFCYFLNAKIKQVKNHLGTSWSGSSSSWWNLLFTVRPDEVTVTCEVGCSTDKQEVNFFMPACAHTGNIFTLSNESGKMAECLQSSFDWLLWWNPLLCLPASRC